MTASVQAKFSSVRQTAIAAQVLAVRRASNAMHGSTTAATQICTIIHRSNGACSAKCITSGKASATARGSAASARHINTGDASSGRALNHRKLTRTAKAGNNGSTYSGNFDDENVKTTNVNTIQLLSRTQPSFSCSLLQNDRRHSQNNSTVHGTNPMPRIPT